MGVMGFWEGDVNPCTDGGNQDRSLSAGAVIVPQGAVSGVKFNDVNNSASFDGGDLPLAGWTITLSGAASASTVTAGDGTYSFADLADGTYTVCETFQGGWVQTFPTTDPGSCTDGNGYSITIASGNTSSGIDFGNNQTGHIIIVKDAVPNDAQNFSFTNNFGNGNPASFDLDDYAD